MAYLTWVAQYRPRIDPARQSTSETAGHIDEKQPTECPICCETDKEVLVMEEYSGKFHSACSCQACIDCVRKWVDESLPACKRGKMLRVQCFGCTKTLPQRVVMECSTSATQLASELERRWKLQKNDMFPECMQVECRRSECIGIGYLGYETIMCMICEDQWPAEEEASAAVTGVVHKGCIDAEAISSLDFGGEAPIMFKIDEKTSVQMRRCPKCKVLTEKNGGCDHMTCKMCRHEYWWSTGKSYRSA